MNLVRSIQLVDLSAYENLCHLRVNRNDPIDVSSYMWSALGLVHSIRNHIVIGVLHKTTKLPLKLKLNKKVPQVAKSNDILA